MNKIQGCNFHEVTHLKSEFVFLLVWEREALADNISQVILHKLHCLREALLYFITWCPIIIITSQKQKNDWLVNRTLTKRAFNCSRFLKWTTYSSMAICDGISDHSRAYLTGVTCSWGSRSTCMCSIMRQNEALRSKGKSSSDMQRRIRSTSSCADILLMARYCRSRHIRANKFSWYLTERS